MHCIFSSFCRWKFLINLMHKMAGRAACYQSWQAGADESISSYAASDEKWHEMEQLKGNFHIKNSRKEIWLRTNGLEVGGNTSQSPQTHLISQENTAKDEEEGTEDQGLLRAEQMAQAMRGQCHPVTKRVTGGEFTRYF